MAVCSRCHKDWPDQYWVCPEDGTVLTAARTATGQMITTPLGIPREEDLRAGTMIGEYRVEGKLGEGGMATVFSATHPLIGKKVAIKVISRRLCADLHAVERFINEARTVNQIGHPNLVDIFAFGVLPDGRAYLVMEWLQGETLAERLARERMPVPRALDVLMQIVDALEAAHEKGIVHRDLKPQNIFVVERGEKTSVKLLDFGIAKLADSDSERAQDALGRGDGDRRLYVARAGARQERRSSHGHLRARLRRLRDVARAAAVRRRHGDRHPGDAPGRRAAGAADAVGDDPGGPREGSSCRCCRRSPTGARR